LKLLDQNEKTAWDLHGGFIITSIQFRMKSVNLFYGCVI